MISSTDWAILVAFKKEVEDLKAKYTHPKAETRTVIRYMEKRIKDIEIKDRKK